MISVLLNCLLLGMLLVLSVPACTPPPPENIEDICHIFKEYPRWYWDAKKTEKKWGVSLPIQMAIIYQESKFDGKARPERTRLLWVIPWKRPSTAYGYSQALINTWDHYQEATGQKGQRDHFATASDFIGWYAARVYKQARIDKNDAYRLYLAYHEGVNGYLRKSYQAKPWLVKVAKKVQSRATLYDLQLQQCKNSIKKSWWW